MPIAPLEQRCMESERELIVLPAPGVSELGMPHTATGKELPVHGAGSQKEQLPVLRHRRDSFPVQGVRDNRGLGAGSPSLRAEGTGAASCQDTEIMNYIPGLKLNLPP